MKVGDRFTTRMPCPAGILVQVFEVTDPGDERTPATVKLVEIKLELRRKG